MKLTTHSALAAYALALSVAHALTIESSDVAPPADIIGEHQPLQKTWTISSLEELEKLHVLVPGRVFIDVEGTVVTPAATKPAAIAVVTGKDDSEEDESDSTSTSGSRDDSDDVIVVGKTIGSSSSSSSSASASASGDSDENDIVFPTPAPTKSRASAVVNATHAPSNKTVTKAPVATTKAPVRVVSDASSSLDGSSSGSSAHAVSAKDVTTQLRRALKEDDSDDDSDDKKKDKKDKKKDKKKEKKQKKHNKPEEAVVAKIVVSGNSSALIDLFDVVPLHERSQNGLKLHLKNQDAVVDGFVLTQIVLTNKNYVRHVSTVLSDDVVIGDGVLVEDDKDTTVKLATSGAGSVFVTSSAHVSLDSLKIDVAGAGSVQLQVPALTLEDTLNVNVAGSGGIALLANASLKTAQIKAAVSGSGDLVVQTEKLASDDLSAAVYGSGSASFASAGNVTTEKLTLSGSGNLFAGSIAAERASVSVWGSGDVIVQATDKLKVTTTFSGSVAYVGARPAEVKTSKWLFWRTDIVHPAAENTVLKYTVVAAPARYPSYASLVTKQVFYSDEPIVKVAAPGAAQASYLAVVSTHLSTVAHGPNGFLIFSMVATTLVVVGLAANSFHKRRVRRHYRPLV